MANAGKLKLIQQILRDHPEWIVQTLAYLEERQSTQQTDNAQRSLALDSLLADLMNQLPDLPSFQDEPLAIQQALRDEWR